MTPDHYLDLHLLPDPEFGSHQLLGALFSKLHRALVQLESKDIGISLPGLGARSPGTHLRLHGTLSALQRLQACEWLTGMRDHLRLGAPAAVPQDCQYRYVRRVQVDSSPERLRRRLMRRHGLDEKTARQRIPDDKACRTDLPWIEMRSQSTGQRFRLFIDHGPLQGKPSTGSFSTYGLSSTATIPWF